MTLPPPPRARIGVCLKESLGLPKQLWQALMLAKRSTLSFIHLIYEIINYRIGSLDVAACQHIHSSTLFKQFSAVFSNTWLTNCLHNYAVEFRLNQHFNIKPSARMRKRVTVVNLSVCLSLCQSIFQFWRRRRG